MGCELCDLVAGNIQSRKYYRDKTCTIVDCVSCGMPVLVFNHCGQASDLERRLAMAAINYLFTYESIRKEARRIPSHEHWHILGARFLGAENGKHTS